jgi:hypothetical protein
MDTVNIKWKTINSKKVYVFEFEDTLTGEAAEKAIEKWNSDWKFLKGPVTIVWDCRNMTSYKPAAFNIWKKGLTNNKDKIAEIAVISNNPLINLGASSLGLFMRYKIKNIRDVSEL